MSTVARAFYNISLRWKAVIVMLGVTAISLILAVTGMLFHTRTAFERQMEQKLFLLADVIGSNSTAALAFNDPLAATETLAALSSDEHIIAGGLYDAQGNLFAQYRRPNVEAELPNAPRADQQMTIGGGRAEITRAIDLKGRTVGAVHLLADTSEWNDILWRFVAIAGILFVVVLTIGFFVSIALQRFVTEPVTDLVQLMRRIALEHDPSLRAVKRGNDELGVLVDGFNGMLDEIGKRRAELERARDQLRHHLSDLNSEVTERKRAEQQIRDLNEDLDRRVKERTAQLEASNAELEAFAYSVSHDLRAPLRGIDGFSGILLSEHAASLNPSGQALLQRVRQAAQRMAELIDDLLNLSRITRSQLTRQDVDIGALAIEVADELKNQNQNRNVQFTAAPDMHAWGDRNLLRVVLENLLGNAWKFTSKRPDARIEFGMKTDEPEPIYYVRDNGAGFDMAYARQLFNVFQRLHDVTEFPGTGIGLATVQRIIKKHGGRIWAQGVVAEGATIYFTLPRLGEQTATADSGANYSDRRTAR